METKNRYFIVNLSHGVSICEMMFVSVKYPNRNAILERAGKDYFRGCFDKKYFSVTNIIELSKQDYIEYIKD